MEKIRVGKDIEISVNDYGDTIRINAEDQNFIEKFYGMLDKLEESSKRVQSEDTKQLGERERLKMVIEETKGIMTEIDSIFGENSCKKIFGDIVPGMYLIADFFFQLRPIVDKYVAERNKDIMAR